MFERRIGHECPTDMIRHHHDGWTVVAAAHLPSGRIGTLLLEALAAHGYAVYFLDAIVVEKMRPA